jgi:SPP1 family predicted phage head-tail adaptor
VIDSIKRHRITVQSVVSTLDSSRQPVYTYTTRYANEPAAFKQVSGGERVRGRQIEAGVTAIFEVNYRSGYQVTDRVLFQGTYYGIVRIDQPEGVNRFTVLYCNA